MINRKLLPLVAVFLLGCPLAAVHAEDIPAEARAVYARLSPGLQPQVRSWMAAEATRLRAQPTLDERGLRSNVRSRFGTNEMDIEAAVFMVMMMMAEDADRDLRQMMAEMNRKRRAAASTRQPVASSAQVPPENMRAAQATAMARVAASPAGSDQLEDLKLQQAMNRQSKTLQLLSSLAKKLSTTQSTLLQNLK